MSSLWFSVKRKNKLHRETQRRHREPQRFLNLCDNVKFTPSTLRILDIGTGSGCIPIALAKKRPDAHVSAWDISEKAIAVAVENARQNNVNVRFMQQDVFAPFSLDTTYDIIVSNPPYVLESQKETICKNVIDFEPHIALFVPNDNPLLFYNRIADIALKLLTPNGKLYFEINREKGDDVSALLHEKGFTAIELRRDISGNNRMIRAQKSEYQ